MFRINFSSKRKCMSTVVKRDFSLGDNASVCPLVPAPTAELREAAVACFPARIKAMRDRAAAKNDPVPPVPKAWRVPAEEKGAAAAETTNGSGGDHGHGASFEPGRGVEGELPYVLHTKGASEVVLQHCHYWLRQDGVVAPLTAEVEAHIYQEIHRMASGTWGRGGGAGRGTEGQGRAGEGSGRAVKRQRCEGNKRDDVEQRDMCVLCFGGARYADDSQLLQCSDSKKNFLVSFWLCGEF